MPAGVWYEDTVAWATQVGYIQGYGDNFGPDDFLTRGATFTILARVDGTDTGGGDLWYENGMDWAVSKGISDGTYPNENVSREQLAVMLWRYAGEPAPQNAAVLDRYPDSSDVHTWDGFREAMAWAVENGLIQGGTDGRLSPLGTATRAQAVTVLLRYCKMLDT